jgi:hypothetical protein
VDLYRIIRELVEERDRVELLVRSLESMLHTGESSAGRTIPGRRGRKSMDALARQEVSERMKRYWATRRREKSAEASEEEASSKVSGS